MYPDKTLDDDKRALHVRFKKCAEDHVNDDLTTRLFLDVDGTALPEFFRSHNKYNAPSSTIWFQCPWSYEADHDTGTLVKRFVISCSQVQKEGDYLMLGLIAIEYKCYDLEQVIATAKAYGYTSYTVDRVLITKCLEFGYE